MFGGLGQAGQRETIRGGRDQDLLTPIWQTVALFVFGAWTLGWLLAEILVIGPASAYVVAVAIVAWIVRRSKRGWDGFWTYVVSSVVLVTGAYLVELYVWPDYVLPWTAWWKAWFSLLVLVMVVPAALLSYVIAVRILDPNYPSPRKAVDQREPQMPWYRDSPQMMAEEAAKLIRVQVESRDPNYQAGMLDLPPVQEWYDFAHYVLRHPDEFSEPTAQRFGVKLDLKSDRAPWYGRGFRQVRRSILDRQWGRWLDESNHNIGFELFPPALEAFRAFCEQGPPE